MRGGSIKGIPHGERLPLSNITTTDIMWSGTWDGRGNYSSITMPMDSWYTRVRYFEGTEDEASLIVESSYPINLTHMSIACDNQFSSPINTAVVFIDYSLDGINWVNLGRDAITLTYFFANLAVDNMAVYIWVPRHQITAKYWRIRMPHDTFSSSYSDDEWHISNVVIGSLDYFRDIAHDLEYTGLEDATDYTSYATPPDNMPWVDVGQYIHTGLQLGFLFVVREGSGYTPYRAFVLSKGRLSQVAAIGGGLTYESYRKNFAILTKSGFLTGIGNGGVSGWDASHPYVYNLAEAYDRYSAIGFAHNPGSGSSIVSPVRAKHIQHGIGIIPNLILGVGSVPEFITHPMVPGVILGCDSSSTESPLQLSTQATLVDDTVLSSLQGDHKCVISLYLPASRYTYGTYTGTGVIDLAVATGLGRVPRVILILARVGPRVLYIQVMNGNVYSTTTGLPQGSDISVIGDTFNILVTSAYINTLGTEYLWWALK